METKQKTKSGKQYTLVPRSEIMPKDADFAVFISGDNMKPYIRPGDRVYVSRTAELDDGDVGIFYVNGEMKCRQYCEDLYGNIYLFSLNRHRRDSDTAILASSGADVFCLGKVLLKSRPPLPRD